jgi:methionyl-tRNA formyltransferase
MGVDAMMESVDLVKAGKAPKIKQDESKATYEGLCREGNAHVDFGKPWEQIDRLIRGCAPAPGAWATINGAKLKILEATPLPARDPKGIAGKLGEVVVVDKDSVTVVCADGRIKLTRVQADGPKMGAGEWAAASKIEKGARFS